METPSNTSFPSMHAAPSHQVSMVDIFLPGFSLASKAAEQLLAGDLSLYAYLACIFGVIAYFIDFARRLASWLEPHMTSTVYVKRSDEVYDMLSAWISAQQLGEAARSSLAQVTKKQRNGDNTSRGTKKRLEYAPWEGSFWFWYRNHPLSFRTELHDVGFHQEEQISLTCLGRSSQVVKDLLNECQQEYMVQTQSKTTIFENRADRWTKVGTKSIRPLSTVILNEKEKQPLIEDIKAFLSPSDRLWYSKRAIPHRRGYLLSGPPGTGKSSLSLSIAGEFDLDIYIVSISNTTDGNLKDLFGKLPETCAVLIEDIDAAGVSLSRKSNLEDLEDEGRTTGQRFGVTMSGLLNTIDGVASQEGRIIIMTTNHVEKLDEALIRPGRVDMRVDFQLADEAVISELFRFILDDSTTEGAKSHSEGVSAIEKQAAEFASKVPPLTFSQAEIMSYLLRHRNLPACAVENSEKWVNDMLHKKRSLKREGSWGSCT